jgi:hypothetical protein
MLELVIVAIAGGIVSRLAKEKGRDPFLFGVLTVLMSLAFGFIGLYFLPILGELIGFVLGGIVMEEIVRNMPGKQKRRQVYCSQCGLKQDWAENRTCRNCQASLHL